MEELKVEIKKTVIKLLKKDRGFTLVEIIVVLVILAILAAFTIPTMLGFVEDARGKAYIAEAREVYVAAQAVATEYSATTNIPDANIENNNSTNYITGGSNDSNSSGLGASLSSYLISRRWDNRTGSQAETSQYRASHQMWRYLEKDFLKSSKTGSTIAKLSREVNLLETPNENPLPGEVAWLVTVGPIEKSNYQGGNLTEMTRTGKVTKIVYKRNGYCVTIEDGNASVTKYTVTP